MRVVLARIILALLLVGVNLTALSETCICAESPWAEAEGLIDSGRYLEAEQVLRKILQSSGESSEGRFLLGFALAKQEKWRLSREELVKAVSLDPRNGRAHTELAGVEFKLGNRGRAIRNLQQAARLDADLEYVHSFLATLLYLENRKTEALYHWNQAGGPRVEKISYSTTAEVKPELIQHLFPLNEGEVFRVGQVLDIRWKQARFGLAAPFNWQITPGPGNNYDLNIALAPGSVLSSLELALLENAVRAPLYREISLQYPMSLRSGRRVGGSFRWDEPRKRIQAFARFPFLSSSSDGLRLGLDLRDEQWRDGFSGTEFLYETRKAVAGYEYLLGGRKSLEMRGGYEYDRLLSPGPTNLPETSHFLLLGTEWNQRIGLSASDDVRLDIDAGLDGLFGQGANKSRSGKSQAAVRVGWLFDRRSQSQFLFDIGGGYAGAEVPLDSFYIFGVGQDNPLPLRAHPAVNRGRKGNSPMGRQYLLANLELRRRVFRWSILEIEGLLFSDTALVGKTPFGDPGYRWFQDVGCGFRLGALGQERMEVLFGFDLKESKFNLWVGIPLARW